MVLWLGIAPAGGCPGEFFRWYYGGKTQGLPLSTRFTNYFLWTPSPLNDQLQQDVTILAANFCWSLLAIWDPRSEPSAAARWENPNGFEKPSSGARSWLPWLRVAAMQEGWNDWNKMWQNKPHLPRKTSIINHVVSRFLPPVFCTCTVSYSKWFLLKNPAQPTFT